MRPTPTRTVIALIMLTVMRIGYGKEITDTAPYSQEKVGLVLSGGGAKGIAHVGVIKALEDNDIPIDYVAGTSMGAIVGSLYSCGWSPEEMIGFFKSKDFGYWSSGVINPENRVYFSMPEKSPDIFHINLNFRDTVGLETRIFPSNLISPLPMNIEFLKLYAPYTEQCGGNFDRLFVPFRCVTSDVYHKHKIVCSGGSLGDAVRASMSFPFVFKPIKMNGVLVYDGGIYDNFPVDVMQKDFDPGFIIGVSVSSPDKKPEPGNIYSQLEDMIIQNNNYSVPPQTGVKIQVPVLNFGVLDFGKADEIYEIGYRTGLSMVDSIKSRIRARRDLDKVASRREKFRSATPELSFDSVSVRSDSRKATDYIYYQFTKGGKRLPLNINQVERSYYNMINSGKLNDLRPQAMFGKDSVTTLLLDVALKGGWNFGLGGWLTSSSNSFLCLNAGYNSMGFNAFNLNLTGWFGQSYCAVQLDGNLALRTSVPSRVRFRGVFSRQKFYSTELLFYKQRTPTFISDWQAYCEAAYEWQMGRKGLGFVSAGYGCLWDRFYDNHVKNYSEARKDKSDNRIAALRIGYERYTLDNDMYPSAGDRVFAQIYGALEKSKYRSGRDDGISHGYVSYPKCRVDILWTRYFRIRKNISLGVSGSGMMTFLHSRQNYMSVLINNPAFAPTPSTKNYFNKAFRSGSYLSAGFSPVWSPLQRLQIRGDFFGYFPMRNEVETSIGKLAYKGWFRRAEFIGEVAAVYNFPFASLSVYGNYLSYPARNWNFGISFGILLQAPRFGQ